MGSLLIVTGRTYMRTFDNLTLSHGFVNPNSQLVLIVNGDTHIGNLVVDGAMYLVSNGNLTFINTIVGIDGQLFITLKNGNALLDWLHVSGFMMVDASGNLRINTATVYSDGTLVLVMDESNAFINLLRVNGNMRIISGSELEILAATVGRSGQLVITMDEGDAFIKQLRANGLMKVETTGNLRFIDTIIGINGLVSIHGYGNTIMERIIVNGSLQLDVSGNLYLLNAIVGESPGGFIMMVFGDDSTMFIGRLAIGGTGTPLTNMRRRQVVAETFIVSGIVQSMLNNQNTRAVHVRQLVVQGDKQQMILVVDEYYNDKLLTVLYRLDGQIHFKHVVAKNGRIFIDMKDGAIGSILVFYTASHSDAEIPVFDEPALRSEIDSRLKDLALMYVAMLGFEQAQEAAFTQYVYSPSESKYEHLREDLVFRRSSWMYHKNAPVILGFPSLGTEYVLYKKEKI